MWRIKVIYATPCDRIQVGSRVQHRNLHDEHIVIGIWWISAWRNRRLNRECSRMRKTVVNTSCKDRTSFSYVPSAFIDCKGCTYYVEG